MDAQIGKRGHEAGWVVKKVEDGNEHWWVGKGWGTEAEPTLLGKGLLKVVEQEEESKEDSRACSD